MRLLALLALLAAAYPVDHPSIPVQAQVYFSPQGGCTDACVAEISAAKTVVLVQAYSFTSLPIAKALKAAKDRGVDVRVILDKSQKTEKYTAADFLVNSGVPVVIDDRHAIAHNKVMVIDHATVITGSFNFTKAAEENNSENLLVLRSADLAKIYEQNWTEHAGHSEAFVSKAQRASP